jgi:hypothetical protein
MSPEQEIARKKKLVRAASLTLSMEFGLAFGADRMQTFICHLGGNYMNEHAVISEFIKAIPADIPYGSARLLWDTNAMLATDSRLAFVESIYRERILKECARIISMYKS